MTIKKKMIWLTNLPAPYRFPIWDHLAREFDLHVYFTCSKRNYRNWIINEPKAWSYSYLNKKVYRFREIEIIPNPFSRKIDLKRVSSIFLVSWEIPLNWITLFRAILKGIPVYIIYESIAASHFLKGRWIAKIKYFYFSKAAKVVTFGPDSTQTVVVTGISKDRILELFNPADVDYYHKFSLANRIESKSGHRYLLVAQLIERKNISATIDAFAQVARPEDCLTIAGEGHLREKLEQKIYKDGLDHQIHLIGHKNQEELAKIYASSDTLILASTNEVWGLVVNEALASGLHVVVSEVCGVAKTVRNMAGVFKCDTSSESISAAMTLSKKNWTFPISNPEILQLSCENFAEKLIRDLNV